MKEEERRSLQVAVYNDFISLKDILNGLKMGKRNENISIYNNAVTIYHDFLSDYYIDIAIDMLFYKIKTAIDYFNKCDNRAYESLKDVMNEIDEHMEGLLGFYESDDIYDIYESGD